MPKKYSLLRDVLEGTQKLSQDAKFMIADQDSPTSKRGPSELDKSLKGKRESGLRNGPSSLGLTIES